MTETMTDFLRNSERICLSIKKRKIQFFCVELIFSELKINKKRTLHNVNEFFLMMFLGKMHMNYKYL